LQRSHLPLRLRLIVLNTTTTTTPQAAARPPRVPAPLTPLLPAPSRSYSARSSMRQEQPASGNDGFVPGLQAWADWTNAHGGIAGRKVQVIILDSQTNPTTALSDARKLVADGAVAVTSANGEEPSSPVISIQPTSRWSEALKAAPTGEPIQIGFGRRHDI